MDSRDIANPERDAGGGTFFLSSLVGCCILVASMALVSLAARTTNRNTAADEASAVRSALQSEINTIAERMRAFAAVTPAGSTTDSASSAARPFWRLFRIAPEAPARFEPSTAADPAQAALKGFLRASPARDDLRGGFAPSPDLLPNVIARADIIRVGNDAAIAVALGARQEHRGDAHGIELVAFERIDEGMLARLARVAGTRPLALEQRAEAGHSGELGLTAGNEDARLALTWTPDTPGDTLVSVSGLALAMSSALFAAFILFRSRRLTQELTDSEARAKADAAHDLLTGLANRSTFQRMLAREIQSLQRDPQASFAVLYLDIDRFKEINDTHGHAAGDSVIVATAQRILQSLRPGDRVARVGGDEFAVLMPRLTGPIDCAALARRVLDQFTLPVEVGSNRAFVTLSIGIAICPNDARTADAITSSADLALYRAKNEGRNRYCFFETRMGEELRMRRTVEEDLRQAIESDQLIMEYQPVMALDGQRMLGVEALVRWRHPTKGTISPASFITLAEECGLILPLGEWVLRQALRQVRRWPNLRVAVNVSAIQFRQKDFVPSVQRLLQETRVEPGQLELELTESVLLADADQAEDAMIELRAMGVRLALDDFGTGYSSLIYLRRFAFDKIKIDKSFLESTETTGESAIIVHSIVHLGRALGLTVTAEGVETPDQHRFLQALGCHELQGFLFSPAVSATVIDERLAALAVPAPLRSVA